MCNAIQCIAIDNRRPAKAPCVTEPNTAPRTSKATREATKPRGRCIPSAGPLHIRKRDLATTAQEILQLTPAIVPRQAADGNAVALRLLAPVAGAAATAIGAASGETT